MKVKAKDYAQVLFELTDQQKEADINKVLKNFVKAVFKNGDMKMIPEIINKYTGLYNKQKNVIDVEIVTAFDFDESQRKPLEEKLVEILNKQINSKYILDKNVLGGFKVVTGDKSIDATLKSRLQSLKSSIN